MAIQRPSFRDKIDFLKKTTISRLDRANLNLKFIKSMKQSKREDLLPKLIDIGAFKSVVDKSEWKLGKKFNHLFCFYSTITGHEELPMYQ